MNKKEAKAIQICGTGSGVGKSVIVAGLCRIFSQEGFKTAPFKAQNMALNSFITKIGGEIGRAQAIQAQAANIEPTVDMNPILMKPTHDTSAQIIIRGKSIGNMDALTYTKYKKNLIPIIAESYQRLKKNYDVIIIEGAGSPAEINLKRHDIVNMKMAELANAPVILAGDIDKGGVFAWLHGTLDLLTKKERDRVKGLLINKFRGEKKLLTSGLAFLEKKTGKKVLGVIPYFKNINIPEEDSVPLDTANKTPFDKTSLINIAVIKLPYLSNFTDMDSLEQETDVSLRYVTTPDQLNDADVIIVPGTKNTLADLLWLKKTNLAKKIKSKTASSVIVGICGGFQILGRKISDSLKIESHLKEITGLELLNVTTILQRKKTTYQVKAKEIHSGKELTGYEIHHGETKISAELTPFCEITKRGNNPIRILDGAKSKNNNVWGTYLHGIFDNDTFRENFLNRIRKRKNLPYPAKHSIFDQNKEYDKLARLMRENIDMDYLMKILWKKV